MNTIHIFHIKHREKIPEEIFRKYLLLLPEDFQKDINAYKHWENALSSLLGKMLLLYGFKKLNLPYVLQDLKIGAKDRPYINTEMDFNISHSGAYVICAIVQNARVGIDIEKHRTLKMNIAERYFDEHECREIDCSEQPEQAFFKFWSAYVTPYFVSNGTNQVLAEKAPKPLYVLSKSSVKSENSAKEFGLVLR